MAGATRWPKIWSMRLSGWAVSSTSTWIRCSMIASLAAQSLLQAEVIITVWHRQIPNGRNQRRPNLANNETPNWQRVCIWPQSMTNGTQRPTVTKIWGRAASRSRTQSRYLTSWTSRRMRGYRAPLPTKNRTGRKRITEKCIKNWSIRSRQFKTP